MTTPFPNPDRSEHGQLIPRNSGESQLRPTGPTFTVRQPMPAVPDNGITPAFFWRVFCQWWKWIVPASLILTVVAVTLVFVFHVPKFESAALIKIESNAPFIAFNEGTAQGAGDLYVQTQIELLRGPVVLAPVLSRPEIASIQEIKKQTDPLKFLQKNLNVSQIGKSELYRVSYTSASPQDAATVANVVVAEYLLMQDRTDKQRSQMVIEVLEKERLDRGERVEQLRKRVVELAKELTGRDPFGQGVITDINAFSSASGLYQGLTEADVTIEVLKAELQSLRNVPIVAADKASASGLLDLEVANRPEVRTVEEHLSKLYEYVEVLRTMPRARKGDSWETDPEYHRLQKQITETKERLAETKALVRQELATGRLERDKAEQEQLIATKTRELATQGTKRDLLSQKFDEHLQELKKGGAQSAELEFAKAELERELRVFELIAQRKLALQTEQRAPARVSPMKTAEVPAIAIEPIPYKYMLLAAMFGLVCPLALAIGHEFIVRRISDSDQLSKESMLPILAEVARLPTRKVSATQPALLAPKQRELYIYAESIDCLRTQLTLIENLGSASGKKVVAICSAASGEGKTSVATALAMSIAETTRRPTLVVDADLRDPDVSRYLAVPSQPGLAEVLSGKVLPGQAIHRVQNTQTFVMPAGKHRVNPHHLLHDSRIEELLHELRENFSVIIIDTPPVLAASEALVYAKAADLVVFCSLAEVSRVKQVRSAVHRLQSTGANIAGAVLSGMSVNRYVYHYGMYQGQ